MTKIGKKDWTALRTGKNAKHTRMYKKHCALRGILNPTTELCDGNCLFQSGLPNWVEHLWPNHPTALVHVSQPILYLSQALGCSWCAIFSYMFHVWCVYVVSLFLRRLGPTKWDPSPFWWNPLGFPRFHSFLNGPTELATKVLTCVLRVCNSPGSRPWK